MSNPEPMVFEKTAVAMMAWPNVTTWRYLGERAEADLACCARFGVAEAPEPIMAFGGGLAYPLPAS